MCDESNDRGDNKLLVILVRIYDKESSSIKTRFLDMPICNDGTGEGVFNTLEDILRYMSDWMQVAEQQ